MQDLPPNRSNRTTFRHSRLPRTEHCGSVSVSAVSAYSRTVASPTTARPTVCQMALSKASSGITTVPRGLRQEVGSLACTALAGNLCRRVGMTFLLMERSWTGPGRFGCWRLIECWQEHLEPVNSVRSRGACTHPTVHTWP